MMLTIQYVFQIDIEKKKLKLTGLIVRALTGLPDINQCTSSNPSQKGKNVLELFIYFLGVVNGSVVLFTKGKLFPRGSND